MDSHNPALKRYIRSISHGLPSGTMKKRFMSQLRDSITDFMQENPEADFEALLSHFGTPQEIAASYLYAQEPRILLRKIRMNKKMFRTVAIFMAVILTMCISLVAWNAHTMQSQAHICVEAVIEH